MVDRFIPPADAAVAVSGMGDPSTPAPAHLPILRWKSWVPQQGRAHNSWDPNISVSLSKDHNFFLETKRWQK